MASNLEYRMCNSYNLISLVETNHAVTFPGSVEGGA